MKVHFSSATTYFCANGHLVDDSPRDMLSAFDFKRKCPFCGNTTLRFILEWHTPMCWAGGNTDALVPHKPLRHDKNGHAVYDVLELMRSKGIKKSRKKH